MAGPWEQYQTAPASSDAGPWTQYGNQSGEHGYAAAPPETPKPAPLSADNPDFLFPTEYGPTPTDLPKPPAQPPPSTENA